MGKNMVCLGQLGMNVSVKTRSEREVSVWVIPVPWNRSNKPFMGPRQYQTRKRWDQGWAGIIVQVSVHICTIHNRLRTVSVEVFSFLFLFFSTTIILKGHHTCLVSRFSQTKLRQRKLIFISIIWCTS